MSEGVPNNFEVEKSPIKEAYLLLVAKTPLELNRLYVVEDQKFMKSGTWDYDNPELVVNKIKDILESVGLENIPEDDREREWAQEILWFWYHHAISCAVGRYKDKAKAQMYAAKALEIQPEDHPNKITRLLSLLVNNKLEEAEEWLAAINEDPEKTTGKELLENYKEGKFF